MREIKGCLHALYRRVLSALDSLVLRCPSAEHRKRDGDVAVVRVDAIGDFLVWTSAAQRIRGLYENERIVLIANAAWAELAAMLPYWDEVVPVDTRRLYRNPFYRSRTLRSLRRRKFSRTIHPTWSRDTYIGDALVRATNAAERIGFTGDYCNRTGAEGSRADRWYTQLFKSNSLQMDEFSRSAEFLRLLGDPDARPSVADLRFALKHVKNPVSELDRYFVLFPGAGWAARQWPAARFSALADRISSEYGLRGVLCGGPADRDLAAAVRSAANCALENVAGRTSLPELAALLRDAELVVANETSAVHLSMSVGVQPICILGGGHFGRFVPYDESAIGMPGPIAVYSQRDCFGCNWRCPYPSKNDAVPCIDDVGIDEVWKSVAAKMRALNAAGRTAP